MNLIEHENIFSGILLLSFMAIMIPKELQGIELNQNLWKKRIILTFAEDEDLPRLPAACAGRRRLQCRLGQEPSA